MLDDTTTCFRHDDRTAAVSCQRCERPICSSCMTQASVGFHCPECVRTSGQKVTRARDLSATSTTPVTVALIAVNVVVHLLSRQVVVAGDSLVGWGVLFGPWVRDGEWWRVVTAGFLHADLFHLGFNMFLLWLLGQNLERVIGSIRFAGVYLAGLLGGSLAVLVFNFGTAGLGASGAVLGLGGAMVAMLWAQGRPIGDSGLTGLLVINLLLPLVSPRISFWGHAGGAAVGFLAGWLVVTLVTEPNRPGPSTAALGGLCMAVFAAAVTAPGLLGY